MPFLRRQRPLVAWLAVVAILLGQWLAHGAAQAGATAWVEVCSGHTVQWVPADPKGLGDDAGPLVAHCPGCVGHAPVLAPPPAHRLVVPALAGATQAPALFFSGPRGQHAWRAAQQRAPPTLS